MIVGQAGVGGMEKLDPSVINVGRVSTRFESD